MEDLNNKKMEQKIGPELFIPKLKKFFLWIFATICFSLTLWGSVSLVNLGLTTYVFTKADTEQCIWSKYPQPIAVPAGEVKGLSAYTPPDPVIELKRCEESRQAQKQREASNAIALILVGAPLFVLFYREARK
jgi:hypothetical protein